MEKKEISVEEYLQLRKEVGIWQLSIIFFGLIVFILGGLLIVQGTRYFIFMYLSVAVMFGMAITGLFPISRVVQACDKANPELRKLKTKGVKVPKHYQTKRLLILGAGLVIVLITFCGQFDFSRGLNRPERVQTPTTHIETPSSSVVNDVRDSIKGGSSNE